MFGNWIVICLYVALTGAAFANPVLAYLNGDRGRLSRAILVTGLISAFGLGTLFYITYENGIALKALAIMGAMGTGAHL